MKNLIKTTINLKKEKGLTLAIDFRTNDDSIGHIQFSEKSWGSDWAIFLNSACIHTSKTLDSAISKLRRLGLVENNFEINEAELF